MRMMTEQGEPGGVLLLQHPVDIGEDGKDVGRRVRVGMHGHCIEQPAAAVVVDPRQRIPAVAEEAGFARREWIGDVIGAHAGIVQGGENDA